MGEDQNIWAFLPPYGKRSWEAISIWANHIFKCLKTHSVYYRCSSDFQQPLQNWFLYSPCSIFHLLNFIFFGLAFQLEDYFGLSFTDKQCRNRFQDGRILFFAHGWPINLYLILKRGGKELLNSFTYSDTHFFQDECRYELSSANYNFLQMS